MTLTYIPKVHHKVVQNLGKDLYLCTDKRATDRSEFEGSSAGGGYIYLGYKSPVVKKVEAYNRRILRLIERQKERKATSGQVETSERQPGQNE